MYDPPSSGLLAFQGPTKSIQSARKNVLAIFRFSRRGAIVGTPRSDHSPVLFARRRRNSVMRAFTDRAAVPAHLMVRILDNEAVFLNIETERYIGLDQTGTRMWQLLTSTPAISAASSQLLDEYDVAPELLRSDLTELLSRPGRQRSAPDCLLRCGDYFSDLESWTAGREVCFSAARCCYRRLQSAFARGDFAQRRRRSSIFFRF